VAGRAQELSCGRLASDQITETPAFGDPGCRHGAEHRQEPVMTTVHVGADADPHPSIISRRGSLAMRQDAIGCRRRRAGIEPLGGVVSTACDRG